MSIRAINLARQLAAERMQPDRLRRLQTKKLRRLVGESYRHTGFYRCMMQRANVRPEDIRTLSDIARLPVVRKSDMLEFSEQDRTNRDRVSRYRTARIATSGSSGEPFEFIVDAPCNAWRKVQYLRPYVSNGRRPWQRVLRLAANPRPDLGSGPLLQPFREHQISCTAAPAVQLAILQTLQPEIVQGYPSALRLLALEMSAKDVVTPLVKAVFTDSEMLTPDTRAIIERAFDAPVLDVYGSFETDNIAYQCASTSDYHVAIDSVIYEVIKSEATVSSGDGNLVVTVLNNLAMPFIRYDLGDSVEIVDTPCNCGRTFPLIRIAAGRSDDFIVEADGRRRSAMSILERLDTFSDLLREYQIVQTSIDQYAASVVAKRPLTDEDRVRIRRVITIDYPAANVEVTEVDRVERTAAAKVKAFICRVPPDERNVRGS